jgi:hypothetical protein
MVLFDLVGNPDLIIYNSTRRVNAVPNEIITQNFTLSANMSGTFQLTIFISTAGANIEYPTVLLVLPKPSVIPNNLTLSMLIQLLKPYEIYIAAGVILIMLILLFLRIRKSRRSGRGRDRNKTKMPRRVAKPDRENMRYEQTYQNYE